MMKHPVLWACAHSGGFNLNSQGWLGRRLINVHFKTTPILDKIGRKLIRPPSGKIKDGTDNGAFWLSRGFFASDLWFPSLIPSTDEWMRVGNVLRVHKYSAVHVLAFLANLSERIRKRELNHSSFLLSLDTLDFLDYLARKRAAGSIHASKSWIKILFFYFSVKPSKHVKKL